MTIRLLFSLSVFLCFVFTNSYASCKTERGTWLKQRHKCLGAFHKLTAPALQPKIGVLEINGNELNTCLEIERTSYSQFLEGGDCEKYKYSELETSFKIHAQACVNNQDRAKCDELLSKLKKVDNIRDVDGSTLLMLAARDADVEGFNYLLSKGADVNKVDHNGRSVIINALRGSPTDRVAERMEIIKKAIVLGASPQKLDFEGRNALSYAIDGDFTLEIMDILLSNGANPNIGIVKNGEVIARPNLSEALYKQNLAVVELLLKKGANPNNADFNMWYPVWQNVFSKIIEGKEISQDENRDKITILLLKNKIDPNGLLFAGDHADGNPSVFALAVLAGAPNSVLGAFFDAGLKLDNVVFDGPWSPMVKAIRDNNVLLVKKLLSNKYKIDQRLDSQGHPSNELTTPDALLYAIVLDKPEIVDVLISAKSDVNKSYIDPENNVKVSPLYMAISVDNVKMVQKLLKAKADPNKHEGDAVPLGVAIEKGNAEIVKMLIGAKANVNAVLSDGESLLEHAERYGNEEIIALLKKGGARVPFKGDFVQYCLNPDLTEKMVLDAIKDGADVNQLESEQGWTPLHAIAQNGKNPKAMSVLIKRGALVNATSRNDYTPFLIAARSNPNPAFLKMLIAAGADIEAVNSNGDNALAIAIAYNTPPVVSMLLNTSLGTNLSERAKNDLLNKAVRNNPDPKVIIALFKAGFKAEPEDSWWNKPLHTALENQSSLEIIKVLLQGKAVVDSDALHIALRKKSDLKLIKMLLQSNAVVDDHAMRLAKDLPMDTEEQKKYRNAVIDMLIKAKKRN